MRLQIARDPANVARAHQLVALEKSICFHESSFPMRALRGWGRV
jgi:hypothetical protein